MEEAERLSAIGAPTGTIRHAQIKAISDALARVECETAEECAVIVEDFKLRMTEKPGTSPAAVESLNIWAYKNLVQPIATAIRTKYTPH